MRKVVLQYTEFHNFEIELEVPDGLSPEETMEWIEENTSRQTFEGNEPYDITTDWDSLEIDGEMIANW